MRREIDTDKAAVFFLPDCAANEEFLCL